MKNGTKIKIDLAVLQDRVNSIDSRLGKIEENHLPHIHETLNKIETKIAYYSGGVVVAGVLLQLLMKYL